MSVPASVTRRVEDAYAEVFAGRFVDALRQADSDEANRVIHQALVTGMAPEAIRSLVMEPALLRIGELWDSQDLKIGDDRRRVMITRS